MRISSSLSDFRIFLTLALLAALFPQLACQASATKLSAQVDRTDGSHVLITWTSDEAVDLYSSDRPDSLLSAAILVAKGLKDGRYLVNVPADRREYFTLSEARTGTISRVAERAVPLRHGSNFRDVGGYLTEDGRALRWGLIYRSAATPALSHDDISYISTLGIRAVVDLRSTEERRLAPSRLLNSHIAYIASDYPFSALPDNYETLLTTLAPQFKSVFYQLLKNNGATVFNCTAGQDRTGVATALILSALGVPRRTILWDYHLSTQYRRPIYEARALSADSLRNNPAAQLLARIRYAPADSLYATDGRSLLAEMFDYIDLKWGSVDAYLQAALEIGPSAISHLRSEYLE